MLICLAQAQNMPESLRVPVEDSRERIPASSTMQASAVTVIEKTCESSNECHLLPLGTEDADVISRSISKRCEVITSPAKLIDEVGGRGKGGVMPRSKRSTFQIREISSMQPSVF